jgi:hypothetical protein
VGDHVIHLIADIDGYPGVLTFLEDAGGIEVLAEELRLRR